ncbi:hypothetical protein VPH35_116773 [Triticum aestivum]
MRRRFRKSLSCPLHKAHRRCSGILLDRNPKSPPTRPSAATHQSPSSPRLDAHRRNLARCSTRTSIHLVASSRARKLGTTSGSWRPWSSGMGQSTCGGRTRAPAPPQQVCVASDLR